MQSVQSCQEATFHCLQLWRRGSEVLELKLGRGAPNIEDACHEQIFFDESVPVRTLTGGLFSECTSLHQVGGDIKIAMQCSISLQLNVGNLFVLKSKSQLVDR